MTVKLPPSVSRALARFEKAVREHEFMGSQPPECFPSIEEEFRLSKEALQTAIAKEIRK